MRFPRRTRLLRNPFDATAYAAVFLLLVMFISLGSRLYTPGVRIDLPQIPDQPGTDADTIKVALDEHGRCFYENQLIEFEALQSKFAAAAQQSPKSLTLLIYMDQKARVDDLLHLQSLARDVGIPDAMIATLPTALARRVPSL